MDVRIAPASLDELGPLARVVARVAGRVTIGEPSHVFTTLGRHRRLFRVWLPFAGTMLMRTHLPRVDVELLVLRTACNCSSPYEWAQHAPLARKAGLSAAEISAVAGGADEALSSRQRTLLAAADDLHAFRVITSATWKELANLFDSSELIELCMLVGQYEMVAMTLNSAGTEPEQGAVALLDDCELRTMDRLRAAVDLSAG